MREPDRTIDYYSAHADHFFQMYERYPFETIHSHWLHVVPLDKKLRVLDVGAGSGRDASWFAKEGHDVIAVEPSDGLRELARDNHPGVSIQWIKDRLPELKEVRRLHMRFDLILLNAVWMHIDKNQRQKGFDDLIDLLRDNGYLVITLRHGSSSDARAMYPVSKDELVGFAKAKKCPLILNLQRDDLFGRTEVSWETFVFCGAPAEA